jgi:hypothetical protein
MSLTTDPNEPCLQAFDETGQQRCYLVLSEAERSKGFTRPLRTTYRHLKCGSVTSMALPIAETYARDPSFYGGTFCTTCATHDRLLGPEGHRNFAWLGADGREDGSFVGE